MPIMPVTQLQLNGSGMDYKGTDGNDTINQKTLGIANGANILGGKGDDSITYFDGNAIGEAGNDTITAENIWASAAYWYSPAGIKANLQTGKVEDGYGTVDTLIGVHSIADSSFDDDITGSSGNDTVWLSGGSNKVAGGGGSDTIKLWDQDPAKATISYNAGTDTFTMVKNYANGDKGTNTLTGVATIEFLGPNGTVAAYTRDMFDASKGFLRAKTSLPSFDMNKVQQMRVGEFNGDGKLDILVVRANLDLGLTAEPLQILLGDGKGGFADGTASVFKEGVIPKTNFVPRIFTADFNKDGIWDIFNPDFGYDAPPFPGGQNSYYLSANGTLASATSTLPQRLAQNHGTSIGDINHDGHLDLLVNALNDSTGNANQLLVNDGTGHFTVSQNLLPAVLRPKTFDAGNTWSMLRDLNGDGWDDIVLGEWDSNGKPSQLVLNDGKGSFAASTPIDLPSSGIAGEIVIGIETIDLNGDALPDMMFSVTNGGSPSEFYKVPYIQLLVNEGNGKFRDETDLRLPQSKTPSGTMANWYLSNTAVDLNGDGFQDIVSDGTAGAPSRVWLNDGTGKFTLGWESAMFAHVVAADVTGDGKPDLIESSSVGYTVLANVFPSIIGASHEYRANDLGERIAGTAAVEKIYSGKGDDTIDGGAGRDTVILDGKLADYTVTAGNGDFTVADSKGLDGTDTLAKVERLKFADTSVALDIDGVGGQAYRIYQAAFNRVPDKAGLGFWISAMDGGTTLLSVAQGFVDSQEFKTLYGANASNRDTLTKMYDNVLHRAPDPGGFAFYLDLLDRKVITVADMLADISESPENKAALVGATQNGFEYTPFG